MTLAFGMINMMLLLRLLLLLSKKRFTNPCDIATTDINNFLQVITPSLSATDNDTLLLPVTLEEIHAVLNSIGPLKAPGPDGLHALFFQRIWPQIHPILFYQVNDFFLNGTPLNIINHTHNALIPKQENPELVNHYRPISLCNVTYKIIAKIIVNRLRSLLDKCLWISPNQGGFAPGKSIFDNILIDHELFSGFNEKKIKSGAIAIKLDLEKAYDYLNWDLHSALRFAFWF